MGDKGGKGQREMKWREEGRQKKAWRVTYNGKPSVYAQPSSDSASYLSMPVLVSVQVQGNSPEEAIPISLCVNLCELE